MSKQLPSLGNALPATRGTLHASADASGPSHQSLAVPGLDESAPTHEPKLGDWYWFIGKHTWVDADEKKAGIKVGDPYEWLGCVLKIGSNFIELHSPSRSYVRVHFDELAECARYEPNAKQIVGSAIEHHQQRAREITHDIQQVAQRLGLRQFSLPDGTRDESRALAVVSAQPDIDGYKNALIKARDKELPELFAALKKNNEALAEWMVADTLPLKASIGPLEDTLDQIKDRIFNVTLYAGLGEDAVKCCDGPPAPMNAILHVMQRRLYMDEECLLDYKTGGMEFASIEAFDKWMAKPKNRDRLLPHPRTLVAMRVRRFEKERETNGWLSAFINIKTAQLDEMTFLYIRNGAQVWRLNSELEFGELIFPDPAVFEGGQPRMLRPQGSRVDKIITRGHYDELVKERDERRRKAAAWERENKKKTGREQSIFNPFYESGFDRVEQYEPFDHTSVHFDDAQRLLDDQMKKYNRIALLLQGLFDRSEVLHPHPPVQTWKPEGFAKAVKLVYDSTRALHFGPKPDFEGYRAKCNATLAAGSFTTGQRDYWMRVEANRENARIMRSVRGDRHVSPYIRYVPYGNPGPALVALAVGSRKRPARQAVFKWYRDAARYPHGPIPVMLSVPFAELLNVTAYQPGDYKQFFVDPRTRAEYLKWAPLLLAAEDWHAEQRKKKK